MSRKPNKPYRLTHLDGEDRGELARLQMESIARFEEAVREGTAPPTLAPSLRPTGVYLIGDGEFGKIGIARDPFSRLGLMQTGNPRPLTLHIFERVENPNYVERCLHSRFALQHVRGEWFKVTVEEVRVALSEVAGILILSPLVPKRRSNGRTRPKPSLPNPAPL